ncbi:MAG: response regulator [Candidatus Wallbacteria bacterium]|nr:response regulator [Candidatus Wallbacteria bacterium]
MRVLVIDDEPDLAEFVARLLRRRGDCCQVTHSAESARILLDDQDFDLVLSDLKMPGMSGVDLYDLLNASKHPMANRMAFMSANAPNTPERIRLERTGRPCLEKPFDAARFEEFLLRSQAAAVRSIHDPP